MAVTSDVKNKHDQLVQDKYRRNREADDIARFVDPLSAATSLTNTTAQTFETHLQSLTGPAAVGRGKAIYDATSIDGLARISAGIESLVTPKGQKWHDMGNADPLSPEPVHSEEVWLEGLRDFLFRMRDNAENGFAAANTLSFRSAVAFGTGVMYVEEIMGRGRDRLIAYQNVPYTFSYMEADAQKKVNLLYRDFPMTARAAAAFFGHDRVSARTLQWANDPQLASNYIRIIHAVQPRDEPGFSGDASVDENAEFDPRAIRDSDFASFYIEYEQDHLIRTGGFFAFPYAIYKWQDDEFDAYGNSPFLWLLPSIRGLNHSAKNQAIAENQYIRPALATAEGIERANLAPGFVNSGLLNPTTGRLNVAPIITGGDPNLSEAIIERKKQELRTSLYLDLFQSLQTTNPNETATRTLLRRREMLELLGPVSSTITTGLAGMIDREVSIIGSKGAFLPGSPLEPPQTIVERGDRIEPEFTGPIEQARRQTEAESTLNLYGAAGQIAATTGNPAVFDKFNDDEAVDVLAEAFGSPARIMRDEETVVALREQRQAQQAAQAGLQLLGEAAEVGRTAGQAQREANESGLADGPVGQAITAAVGG